MGLSKESIGYLAATIVASAVSILARGDKDNHIVPAEEPRVSSTQSQVLPEGLPSDRALNQAMVQKAESTQIPSSPEEEFKSFLSYMKTSKNPFLQRTALGYEDLMQETPKLVVITEKPGPVTLRFGYGILDGRDSAYQIYIPQSILLGNNPIQGAAGLRYAFLVAQEANSIEGSASEEEMAIEQVDIDAVLKQVFQEAGDYGSQINPDALKKSLVINRAPRPTDQPTEIKLTLR